MFAGYPTDGLGACVGWLENCNSGVPTTGVIRESTGEIVGPVPLAVISWRLSSVSITQRLVVVVFMAFSISFPGSRVRFHFLSNPVASFTP